MARTAALAMLLSLLASGCVSFGHGASASGVVSASNLMAAQAGASVLDAGGNAVDAAAAVQWALEVTEPSMSGLGGGALILLWLHDEGRLVYIDGRESAPASARPDQFTLPNGAPMDHDAAERMGIAVGVPGTLKAFDLAERSYGKLGLRRSFTPAIALAHDGIPVDHYLSSYITSSADKLRSWPPSAQLFLTGARCPPDALIMAGAQTGCQGGTPLQPGDRLVQPDLAATFRQIQDEGIDAFYGGPIGADVQAAVADRLGTMTADDLRGYVAKERAPTLASYRGVEVASAAPPSAGGLTMGEILRILEPMAIARSGPLSTTALHDFIEASHLAYADRRAYIGDSDVVDVPQKGLIDPGYAAERRFRIDPTRADAAVGPGDPWPYEGRSAPHAAAADREETEGLHTTHFTVVDRWGNIASVTSTIEDLFGSGILVPGRGILLNNELTDFDFTPGGPNEVGPHKRPRSSMAPTILLRHGKPFAAFGSPGGSTITTTVAQIVLDVVEFGMPLDQAVRLPRVFSSDYPVVQWEPGVPAESLSGLRALGHQPEPAPVSIGNVQGAWLDGGSWHGVADVRDGPGGVAYSPMRPMTATSSAATTG